MRTYVFLGLLCLALGAHIPGLQGYYPQELIPKQHYFHGQQVMEPEFTENIPENFVFCNESVLSTNTNGTCHNLAFPLLGLSNNIELRFGDAAFEDGRGEVNEEKVSARLVSNTVIDEPNGLPDNIKETTRLLIFLGQFIDHDFALTLEQGEEEDGETLEVNIPDDDPVFEPEEFEFFRSVFVRVDQVREFTSINTPWLDLGNVYGDSQNLTDQLRTFENGTLNTSIIDDREFPPRVPEFPELFLCGDIRCEENPQLFAFHTLFLREHNRIAGLYLDMVPNATDEEVFQFARLLNINQYQSIIWDFYLPYLLGRRTFAELTGPYLGHIQGTDPTLSVAFASAVYRYGHSGVPNELLFLDTDGNEVRDTLALPEAFLEVESVLEAPENLPAIFIGQGTTAHAPLEQFCADAIRNELFANVEEENPNRESGLDLITRNILRCRDHGCPNLNNYRFLFGLEPIECPEDDQLQCFTELTGEEEIAQQLFELYEEFDECDLFVCGMAEKTFEDSLLGETFTVIMADQFKRLRDGDRIWYELIYEEEFSEEFLEMANIRFPARLADVVVNNLASDLEGTEEFTNAMLIDLAYVAWVDGSNIQVEWADPEEAREAGVEGYEVTVTFPDGSTQEFEFEPDEQFILLSDLQGEATYTFEVVVDTEDGEMDITENGGLQVSTLAAVGAAQGDGLIAGLQPAVFGGIIGGVAGGVLLIGGGVFLIKRANRFKNDDINAQFF